VGRGKLLDTLQARTATELLKVLLPLFSPLLVNVIRLQRIGRLPPGVAGRLQVHSQPSPNANLRGSVIYGQVANQLHANEVRGTELRHAKRTMTKRGNEHELLDLQRSSAWVNEPSDEHLLVAAHRGLELHGIPGSKLAGVGLKVLERDFLVPVGYVPP